MSRQTPDRRGERGAALVVSLLIMATLALLGAAMIASSVMELKIGGSQRQSKADFYAADGATRLLINRLSSATDTVGNVADPDTANQLLVPNAAELADPAMPGWALVGPGTAQGATPTWVAGPLPFSYHYRIIYLSKANPPRGYSVTNFAGFYYEVDCVSGNTAVSTINMKVGPK